MKPLIMRARKYGKRLALAALIAAPIAANAQVANISTTDLTTAGLNVSSSLVSAISNTYFANDGNSLLVVRNVGVAVTATLITQAQSLLSAIFGPVALANQAVSIPPSSTLLLGPFPKGRWNNPLYDTVAVSFTSVVGISESVVRLPQ